MTLSEEIKKAQDQLATMLTGAVVVRKITDAVTKREGLTLNAADTQSLYEFLVVANEILHTAQTGGQ